MKTCIIFFVALFIVALAITEEEQLKEIDGYIKQCQAKFELTDEFIDQIGSKQQSDPKKAGEFALCFTTSIGVQTQTGDLVGSRIKEFLQLFQVEEKIAEDILTKCKRQPNSSAEESALSLLQCLDDLRV